MKYQLLVQSSQAGIDQFTVTHKLPPVIVVREMDPRVRNFIFSFSYYYLLSTYYMPDTLLDITKKMRSLLTEPTV